MSDEDKLKTISFRADKEKIEELDHLIARKNVALGPGSEEKISRSGLLRDCISEMIDELEEDLEEGNSNPTPMATAD